MIPGQRVRLICATLADEQLVISAGLIRVRSPLYSGPASDSDASESAPASDAADSSLHFGVGRSAQQRRRGTRLKFTDTVSSNSVSVAGAQLVVYNSGRSYTREAAMGRATLTRTNLLLETAKIRQLRKVLQSRSNSEAVRCVIDERLAVGMGLQALRSLRKLGGPEDVFRRARAKKR